MFAPKKFSSIANASNSKSTSAITLSLILVGGLLLFSTGRQAAGQEMIMPIGDTAENCELNWYWDDRTGQLAAWLDSAIVITDVSDSSLKGKITSTNNNHTLYVYNDESVVMAQFGYDYGYKGNWYVAAKPSNGLFAIDIPAAYADADYVKLWVNGNSFVMQPPEEEDATEVSAEEESSEEDSTTITSTANSTTTTTTISKTVETDSATNSTIVTITTVTEITPTEESEATNSTTITTVTTTTIDAAGVAKSSTTTTTTTEPVPDESEDQQTAYVIGGNMTISHVNIHAPEGDYWINDGLTLFFEEGHFKLDRDPLSRHNVEEDIPAQHQEVYQTQINVMINSAMVTYEFGKSEA